MQLKEIFETLYFAAVTASAEEAKKDGPYETYKGSPMSKGEFQHNLWGIKILYQMKNTAKMNLN